MRRSARASRSLVGPHWFTHSPPTGPHEDLALHKTHMFLNLFRRGLSKSGGGSPNCFVVVFVAGPVSSGVHPGNVVGTVVGPGLVSILSVPVSTKSSGAAKAFDVLAGIVGIAPLGAMMTSSTSKCLPEMRSSSSILAAGVEGWSPPTGSDFSVLSTESFHVSNAVKSASAMALHMSDGYAARASVL